MAIPTVMYKTLTDYVVPTTEADVAYYRAQGYLDSKEEMMARVEPKQPLKFRTKKA